MNKITGTIIDSGFHVDAGGRIPGVSIAANVEELQLWDGPLYGRRVVIVEEADYDAREEGIEQLCEQMGQLRVALAAREADEERLRDVKRQRVAEGMSRWCKPQSPHLGLDSELSSALAEADRVAALVEEAAAEVAALEEQLADAAWEEQLADVVRVIERIDEAAKAGKGAE